MLNIVIGRAGQDGRLALLERMERCGEKCALLVPDQYSHECEREMCRVLGNDASGRCEVLSFTRLARRLTDLQGGGAAPTLDEGGRILLLYRALRQTADSLKFYRSPSRKPAFLNSLLATVDECISYRVAPETLMELGREQGGSQGDKWQDIGLILSAYESLCLATAADPRAGLDRLLEQIRSAGWGENRSIFVHGFTDFTIQQENILMELAKQGRVTVFLVCGESDDLPELTRVTAWRLKKAARQDAIGVEEEILEGYERLSGSLAFAEQHLYGPLPPPWTGRGRVERVKCADLRGETQWAASEVLRLVRDGLRWRDIALCAPDMERYEETLRATFQQYGIPLFESTMQDVLQKPVLALVTAALSAVAQDYPYEEMFRYLKTDLTGISREDRDLLENYVLTWEIRGGTWMRAKPWNMHPEGYGKTLESEHEALLTHLDELRRRVIAPLEKLRRSADPTGRGRAMALYQFLVDIDLERGLQRRVADLEGRGALNEAAQYRQLWEIVISALEQCALYVGDVNLEAEEFSRLFALVLSRYDVGSIPVALDRVTVGDARRMVHKRAKVLFFLGTDSGSIPMARSDGGLFSQQDRDALAGLDVELAPGEELRLRREMNLAYEVCAVPTEGLYLSYAAGGAGEERQPCFLWERFERLFPDHPATVAGESRLAAPLPALELAGKNKRLAEVLKNVPECVPALERLEQAGRWKRGSLSPRGVETLFGSTVPMSATRLDLFNSCHFSHFLRYGLEAKPRQTAGFRPTEYGTFVHEVLEKVLGEARDRGGAAALAGQSGLCRTLAEQAADDYARRALPDLEEESARFRWLFERMKGAALAVTESVVEELAVSEFTPVRFELGFGRGKELPPIEVENGVRLRLSGYVDRVDQWEHEGKRYLRVIDYKTGKKSFEFADIEDGRGLQMLLYLFALSRMGEQTFGPGEIVPAGVLYVPARNPLVNGNRAMTAEEVARKRGAELRRQGLVLNDPAVIAAMETSQGGCRFLPITEGRGAGDYLVTPEQMKKLETYIQKLLTRAAGEMAGGNVNADPYWHDREHNACRWCEYREACHFEESCGDRSRLRKGLSSREFWANRGEEDG